MNKTRKTNIKKKLKLAKRLKQEMNCLCTCPAYKFNWLLYTIVGFCNYIVVDISNNNMIVIIALTNSFYISLIIQIKWFFKLLKTDFEKKW